MPKGEKNLEDSPWQCFISPCVGPRNTPKGTSASLWVNSIFFLEVSHFQTVFAGWTRGASCYRSRVEHSYCLETKLLGILSPKSGFLTQVSMLPECSVLERAERKTSGSGQFATSMDQVQLAVKINGITSKLP